MRHQNGKVIWFSAHHFKGSSFQAKFGCSRYVLTTILESTVEGLDCCVATELSMNDHNADGSCSVVEDESTD